MSKESLNLLICSKEFSNIFAETNGFIYRLSATSTITEKNGGLYLTLYNPDTFDVIHRKIEKIKRICIKLKRKN